MKTITFKLDADYIELNKLLKITRQAATGGHANMMITTGEVKLNGHQESRKRAKIRVGDTIETVSARIDVVAGEKA